MRMRGLAVSACLAAWLLIPAVLLPSQDGPAASAEGQSAMAKLPSGFRDIVLGLSFEAVKERLQEDPYFDYRGEPDVSLRRTPNRQVIETDGYLFIDRAFFQFFEDRLYTIILRLNPRRIDYFTMYRQLTGTYGPPDSLNPSEAVWESPDIRMALERPVVVKYLELPTFRRLQRTGRAEESLDRLSRDRFLDQF
jgi:hypothetical protein